MLMILFVGILLCLVLLYALCKAAKEADQRLEQISLQPPAIKGGE